MVGKNQGGKGNLEGETSGCMKTSGRKLGGLWGDRGKEASLFIFTHHVCPNKH